jgi:hypothetical protein
VFWTWPHVVIDGKEYDLWIDRGIRQKFVRWLGREAGPADASLGVENGWFVGDEQVMTEKVVLHVYPADEGNRAIDLELTFTPTDKPVTLWGAPGKSYGGLTVRLAPSSREATTITVPSGRTTADLPDTRLAWADFTSVMLGAEKPSGAAIFVPPDHPDYPPTWLTRHYGPLCIGWPGVKAKTFQPGESFRLSYRLWIHRGLPEHSDIQRTYDAYAAGLKARSE